MSGLHGPALVTLGNLVLCFVCAALVGRARIRYRIPAPATTGHEGFDLAFRAQMNTLENTVIFLPALWMCALWFGPAAATGIGLLWLVARVWYVVAYTQDARKRGGGFGLSLLAWAALMILAAWGVLRATFAF